MYNSINLPLSTKKIWKKSIEKSWVAFCVLIFLSFYSFIELEPLLKTGSGYELFGYLLIGGTGLILLLFIISIFIYEYYYYKLYYYNFTNEGAEVKKGVITVATGHIRYDRLQSIYIDQDLLDRIFGLYNIHYETAGEKSGFYSHVDGLPKESADKLVNFLKEKQNTAI